MWQKKNLFIVFVAVAACPAGFQCDDGDSKDDDPGGDTGTTEDEAKDSGTEAISEEEDTGTGDGEDTVKGTIVIPEEFDGEPVSLGAMFFSEGSMEGMPDEFGDSVLYPDIEAGGTFTFVSSQAGLAGAYYLAVVLYCEGGGSGYPAPGVDWVGATAESLTLGPGTGEVDAGRMELILAE